MLRYGQTSSDWRLTSFIFLLIWYTASSLPLGPILAFISFYLRAPNVIFPYNRRELLVKRPRVRISFRPRKASPNCFRPSRISGCSSAFRQSERPQSFADAKILAAFAFLQQPKCAVLNLCEVALAKFACYQRYWSVSVIHVVVFYWSIHKWKMLWSRVCHL